MGDILKKIKHNFLGQNNFSVGFNNNSPVKGISRKASPLNNYQSSANFEGSSGATSSYKNLMASHYGNPVVPDNKELGDVLSKAVGQFGYMGAHVSDEIGKALGADGEGGSPWHRQASPLNENGDDDPDNEEENGSSTQNTVEGADEAEDDYSPNTNTSLNPNNIPAPIANPLANQYTNAKHQQAWGEGSYGTRGGENKPNSASARFQSMTWW